MQLRNIAIIAHVDHGKTTLVDCLLKQSGLFRENEKTSERMMDSNDQERERGITILAKATSVVWNDYRINIVDTPGHADFGGEVERILNMVDGAIVLVDAAEGPMPQTKFVVSKALKIGLRPIVCVNKIDKPEERHNEVVNEVFDLFANLDATDEQLDFPIIYGSAKNGWMSKDPAVKTADMTALFETVIAHVPPPVVQPGPFRLLGTTIGSDPFLGRILTGRVAAGSVKPNQTVKVLSRTGDLIEQGRVSKVLAFRGLTRAPIDEGVAGDIVSIAGLTKATVADTVCDPAVTQAMEAQPIDPPTLAMTFRVNDSPLAGTEGKKVTSRVIWDRLQREAEGNVALRISRSTESESFEVAGRGELQLAVLIETMRREGFELGVSRPKVVMQKDETSGETLEPIEEVTIDVDDEHSGVVVQKLSERRAEMMDMRPSGVGRTRLVFHAPTRGLIGYQGELLSDTRGTAVMNRIFLDYEPFRGEIPGRRTGVLISNAQGEAVAYALFNLQERGPMMIDPGTRVYQGMIVGEHSRGNDLEVNVLKGKQLTNIRAAGKDENVLLTPPMKLSLERALSYIEEDELVEVTPQSIRLRKAILDPHARKRAERARTAAA
jgi:GTP-binding protein